MFRWFMRWYRAYQEARMHDMINDELVATADEVITIKLPRREYDED